jgi:hypothetical protein
MLGDYSLLFSKHSRIHPRNRFPMPSDKLRLEEGFEGQMHQL